MFLSPTSAPTTTHAIEQDRVQASALMDGLARVPHLDDDERPLPPPARWHDHNSHLAPRLAEAQAQLQRPWTTSSRLLGNARQRGADDGPVGHGQSMPPRMADQEQSARIESLTPVKALHVKDDMSIWSYAVHMSLRIALLGTLAAHGPASGYELSKAFDDSVNHVWQAKHSQIYPELAKMVTSGAVTVEDAGGGRGRKVYTVTETGQGEIINWLTDENTHRSNRNETALRAFLISLLEPREAAAVMRAEADRHSARLDELEKLRAVVDGRQKPDGPRFGNYALDLGIRTTRMLQQWAVDTAEDLERRSS
jgi:DNA-binding PadR family transcriptional regulator